MRTTPLLVALRLLALLAAAAFCQPAGLAGDQGSNAPYGLSKRVAWTTSRVKGSPEPPLPYYSEPAFPKLKFTEPLDMTSAPGSDRLFVAERYGRLFSFKNDRQTDQADLLLDVGKVVYGMVFHPKFAANGYFYVTYVVDATQELPRGTRVVRYQVSQHEPPRCDPSTEQLILDWPSGGHNGGCLKFGPDGYLYIATGDSSGIADEYQTGQDLSKLPGSILRIDVDHPEGGKNYSVPRDNPFVEVEGARPEIWAYGLRQPWKMSFDPATGRLWAGNVGQDLWEQIFLIERGGNYGWSVTEGSHPFRPERPRGPTPILQPIVEHSHTVARSITGGYVYHGSELKDLAGAYLYGDYDTGMIWSLRYDGETVTEHQQLADTTLRLVGFGEDHQGEIYLVDHMGGGIHRLAATPASEGGDTFPRKLSETGLFESTAELAPAPGLIPYSVVAPRWDDGAEKEFYMGLPGDSQIEFETIEFPQPAPGGRFGWKFPDGAVLVQTLSLEMETGDPNSRKRLETRILHNERLTGTEEVGDQYWRGYTYLWDDAQTDATLLEDPEGLDRTYVVRDSQAPGGQRQQTWHFPSRSECILCHNMAAKYVLGMETLQMNSDHDYDGVAANQMRTLEHLGIFTKPLPATPEELPRLVDYRDEANPLDPRARSYLHANCSHCHRKWGGGNADFQFLFPLPLAETGALNTRPGHGTFQMHHARVLASGDPYRSVLLYRMAKLGRGRMPRVGSNVVDDYGVRLVRDWIAELAVDPNEEADTELVAQLRQDAQLALERLRNEGGRNAELRTREIDRLLASTGDAVQLLWAIEDDQLAAPVRRDAVAKAVAHADPDVRDLFERFLPEEQRPKRLGTAVKAEEILALSGDADNGKRIFFEASGVLCRSCHKINGEGTDLGPDLSEVGKKFDRAKILDTILDPSKEVDPKFALYLAETSDGKVYTGLLAERTATEVVLKDAQNKAVRLAADDIELLVPQQQSMMPELLLRDMTAREVADLTEFLSSLK